MWTGSLPGRGMLLYSHLVRETRLSRWSAGHVHGHKE